MICTEELLVQALDNYKNYKRTIWNYLDELRADWIPIEVEEEDRANICSIAESILNDSFDCNQYNELKDEYKIAVGFSLMSGYTEEVLSYTDNNKIHDFTDKVFSWLKTIESEHAILIIRNHGPIDGSRLTFKFFTNHIFKVDSFMDLVNSFIPRFKAKGMK